MRVSLYVITWVVVGLVAGAGLMYIALKQQALFPDSLAYAKMVATRTPFMAIPGTDPDELRTAIEELKKTRQQLSEFQQDASAAEAVVDALYPTDFLEAVADAEEARLVFVKDATQQHLHAYHNAILRAFAAYHRNLDEFRDAFKKSVPEKAKRYETAQELVGREDMLALIDRLEAGADKKEAAFTAYRECLKGIQEKCDASLVEYPTPKPTTEETSTASAWKTAQEVRNILIAGGSIRGKDVIVELQKSVCTELQTPTGPFFSIVNDPLDPAQTHIQQISDLRFVRSKEHLDTGFFSYFEENNGEYVFVDIFSYYNCLAVGQDISALFATMAVRDFAQQSQLSHIVALPRLRVLESSLASEKVRERDALEYLGIVRGLLKEGQLQGTVADTANTLLLQTTLGSSHVEWAVHKVAWVEQLNIDLAKKGVHMDLAVPYLFYVRNALLLFSLSNNYSVVGRQENFFNKPTIPLSEQPYEFYSLMPHTNELRDTLVRNLNLYHQLYEIK